MQPSPPDAQNQIPQNNPAPMQANPAPVNYESTATAPYPHYPQNMQPQFAQAPQPVAGAPQITGGHGGEKVIQPIHDINEEQQQSEIQRQMAELLGEAVEPNSLQAAEQNNATNSAQAIAQMQPTPPAAPYAPLPPAAAPTAYNQPQPGAYPQQAYYQQPDPQAAAAMQMQALQAEEMRKAQYAQAVAAQQMAAQQAQVQAQARAQAQAQYQQQMSSYSQISPADAQKVANSIVTPPIPMPPTPTTMPPSATPPAQSIGQEVVPPLDTQQNNG